MTLTPEKIAELKSKHNTARIYKMSFEGAFELYLRHPPFGEYQRLMQNVADPKTRAMAQVALAEACIVHPPIEEVRPLLHERPFVYQKIADMLGEEMGSELEAKKTVL